MIELLFTGNRKQSEKAFEDVYKSLALDSENGIAYSTLAEIYAEKKIQMNFIKT